MLLVKTEVRESQIHGIGCFVLEDVKAGQKIWVFDPRIDTRFPVDEIYSLPEAVQEFVNKYGFEEIVDGQRVITLCGDDAKYMNHSDHPNTATSSEDPNYEIAVRDISRGEELTTNYYSFDLDAEQKLCLACNAVAGSK